MQERIEFNQFKGIVIATLFIILILKSGCSHAQSMISHIGFQANFGTSIFDISSDIPELNAKKVTQSGGLLGVVAGNETVRARIGLLGYYSSDNKIAGTVDLYKSNASINFYPLALFGKKSFRVQPYFTGAVAYDRYKFYGFYLNSDRSKVNFSKSEAPYLGTFKQVNSSLGGGIELKLLESSDFVHFFMETRFAHNLDNATNNARFDHTKASNKMQVLAGLSFGMIR
jgi:hypothetical protein